MRISKRLQNDVSSANFTVGQQLCRIENKLKASRSKQQLIEKLSDNYLLIMGVVVFGVGLLPVIAS